MIARRLTAPRLRTWTACGAILWLALGASAALAGGPRNVNGAGEPMKWTNPLAISYQVESGPLGGLINADAQTLVSEAFNVWQGVRWSSADAVAFSGTQLGYDVHKDNYRQIFGWANDERSPVIFDSDGAITEDLFGKGAQFLVLGFSTLDNPISEIPNITGASIVINGAPFATCPPNEPCRARILATMVHEVGHFLNLDHALLNAELGTDGIAGNDIYVPSMFPVVVDDEAALGALHADDEAALLGLYGYPIAPPPAIAGSVVLPDGAPMQGAHVVLRKVGDPLGTAYSVYSGDRYFPCMPGSACNLCGAHAAGCDVPPPAIRGQFAVSFVEPGDYTVCIDQIATHFDVALTNRFLSPHLNGPLLLPGPEECYNGAGESEDPAIDDPDAMTPVTVGISGATGPVTLRINRLLAADSTPPEPNDTLAGATLVDISSGRNTVAGFLTAGDLDFHAVSVAAGERLVVDLDAAEVGSGLDALIGVYDANGVLVTTVDNAFDPNSGRDTLDPALSMLVTVGGLVRFVVASAGDDDLNGTGGRTSGPYWLRVERDRDADGAVDRFDACPSDSGNDADGDGHCADVDNCPILSNPNQVDTDGDGLGDRCETDRPLMVSTAWTAEGNQALANFGTSIAPAGDINRDGYDDVLVGAYRFSNSYPEGGGAFLYLGSPAGLSASAIWSAESNQAYSEFGRSVASAGDVNGDGYQDVVVGAPGFLSNGVDNAGKAFLYQGSSFGLSPVPAWSSGPSLFAHYGWSVASAGDVNGDGFSDVIIGAPYHSGGRLYQGGAFLYLGSPLGLSSTPATTIEGDRDWALLGYSVASAGDVNGDGFDDVIVGASNYSNGQTAEGQALLYLGSPLGLSSSPVWSIESNNWTEAWGGAKLGRSVSTAGDVNADGYDDVIIGAPHYSNNQGRQGRALLYLGGSSGLTLSHSWVAEGDRADNLGSSVSSAGDVNGDGYGDVVVGGDEEGGNGRAYVYLGSSSGLSTLPAWIVDGEQSGDFFGARVASAGDVNNDGVDDVIASDMSFTNGQTYEGRVYLFLGLVAYDQDGDGVPDATDNCPTIANPGQGDADRDGMGDACDYDRAVTFAQCYAGYNDAVRLSVTDWSGAPQFVDVRIRCGLADTDWEVVALTQVQAGQYHTMPLLLRYSPAYIPNNGVLEDPGPTGYCSVTARYPGADPAATKITIPIRLSSIDSEGDGVYDDCDNCPTVFNPQDPVTYSQPDADHDAKGDACDSCPLDPANDVDSDSVCGNVDNCPAVSNTSQADTDGDGAGDACDVCPSSPANDADGDGVCEGVDNCPTRSNPTQHVLTTKLNGPLATGGRVVTASLSGDGLTVVYRVGTGGVGELFSAPVTGGSAIKLNPPLVNGGTVVSALITPDSRRVIYHADQDTDDVAELYSVPIGSGPVAKLNPPLVAGGDIDFGGYQVSPNSSRVVYTADQELDNVHEIYSVPVAGGPATKLNGPLASGAFLPVVRISLDGTKVVYMAQQDTPGVPELYSVPIGGGLPVKLNAPLVAGGEVYIVLEISPDNSRVTYIADQDTDNVFELYSVPIDGGVATKVNAPLVASGNVWSALISPDSSRVVYRADQDLDERYELYSAPLAGGPVIKLNGPLVAGGNVTMNGFRISPDGTRVVYQADQDTVGVEELYSVNIAGGPATKLNGPLIAGGTVASNPAFAISVNSARVVYNADQNVNDVFDLYSVPLAGGVATKLNPLMNIGGNVTRFQISPDSSTVVYTADQITDWVFEVFAVPIAGGTSARISGAPTPGGSLVNLDISPVGPRVIYGGDQDTLSIPEIYSALLDPDTDHDGILDTCDLCPTVSDASRSDTDGDGVGDACDNCPTTPNPDQANSFGLEAGDACEVDLIPPSVSSIEPADGSQNVGLSTSVLVYMTEPVDPATATLSTILVEDSGTQERVSGTIAVADNIVSFDPIGRLEAGRGYTVRVTSGLNDLSGNGATPSTSTFSTVASTGYGTLPAGDIGDEASGAILSGDASNDQFGFTCAIVGDVNGGAPPDLVSAAPYADVGAIPDAGKVRLVFGGVDLQRNPVTSPAITYSGSATGQLADVSLAPAGDLNGDLLADFVIGAPHDAAGAGAVYVVFGDADLDERAPTTFSLADLAACAVQDLCGVRIVGDQPGDLAGASASFAGDLNDDGSDDLLIGAPGATPVTGREGAGRVYILYGPLDHGTVLLSTVGNATPGLVLHGENAGDAAGAAVSRWGDFSGPGIGRGDGKDDFLVGAPGGDATVSGVEMVDVGYVYGIHGGDLNLDAKAGAVSGWKIVELSRVANGQPTGDPLTTEVNGFVFLGSEPGESIGRSVTGSMDTNDDGSADVQIAGVGVVIDLQGIGPKETVGGGGRIVKSIPGRTTGLTEPTALRIVRYVSGMDGVLGPLVVAGAGDVNNDGLDDFVAGAPQASPLGRESAGKVWIVYGRPMNDEIVFLSDVGVTVPGLGVVGAEAMDQLGHSVSGGYDVTGDGVDDVLLGAPFGNVLLTSSQSTPPEAGEAYVLSPLTACQTVTTATFTCGVGACLREGETLCVLSGASAELAPVCTEGTPQVETCNSIDDDCDGAIDQGLGATTCGVGSCTRTVDNCQAGQPQTCTPGSPADEVCDGEDNDCDNATDEDLGVTTCGLGVCARTVVNCVAGQPQICTPGPPGTETCDDGADNDCDGTVDEGCFRFSGFFQPVDNEPVVNTANAGSAIPVKFSLGGFQGYGIFLDGYPKVMTIACSPAQLVDAIEQTVSASASELRYDAVTDTYNYVWKTTRAMAGTCRVLQLGLTDGTIHTARFSFKR